MTEINDEDVRGFFEDSAGTDDSEVRAVRRPGAGALLHLATLVPLAVASLLAMVPLAALVLATLGRDALIALVVVWWLPLPLLSFRPAASMLARWKGYREPTAEEAGRLAGPWDSLLRRANLPEGRYLLMVRDTDEADLGPCDGFTSGFPVGGHVVAVPAAAVAQLQPQELEAVLAHYLGHQLGMDTVTRLLAFELWVPLLLIQVGLSLAWFTIAQADRVIFGVSRIAAVFLGPLAVLLYWATVLLGGFMLLGILLFAAPWLLLMAVLYLAALGLGRLVRYTQEYGADATAVGLGLGHALLAALELALRGQLPGQPRYERVLKLRPLAIRRTERLRAGLARTGG